MLSAHVSCRRAQQPLESLHSNLDASIALLKASLADTRAAAAASKAAAAASAARSKARVAISKCSAGTGTSDVPKSVAAKHIMRYSCEEVSWQYCFAVVSLCLSRLCFGV